MLGKQENKMKCYMKRLRSCGKFIWADYTITREPIFNLTNCREALMIYLNTLLNANREEDKKEIEKIIWFLERKI